VCNNASGSGLSAAYLAFSVADGCGWTAVVGGNPQISSDNFRLWVFCRSDNWCPRSQTGINGGLEGRVIDLVLTAAKIKQDTVSATEVGHELSADVRSSTIALTVKRSASWLLSA